ncbi:MAG: helix-hairpin-helix domain-containing protein, partial [Bacillota bacterium]|nr:helix-hairpin-helix domain-containing protein [Bacillota bacterium]
INLAKALYDGMVISVPDVVATPKTYVYVDVKGAIRYPGVYRVEAGLRVYDVVMLAGGFTAGADASEINLALTVKDEMMIVIPFVSTPDPDDSDPDVEDEPDNKININTATVEELDRLYGIGYILAQRIIDYRAEYGAYETIEDIMKVDGIKDTVYEAIKDDICV